MAFHTSRWSARVKYHLSAHNTENRILPSGGTVSVATTVLILLLLCSFLLSANTRGLASRRYTIYIRL